MSKTSFDVPAGAAAKVHIIDCGFRLSGMPTAFLLAPAMRGFDELPPMGSWSFLVESSTGPKVLFDLGGPSDFSSFNPSVTNLIKTVGVKVEGTKPVSDILATNGVDPGQIESVIYRYVLGPSRIDCNI